MTEWRDTEGNFPLDGGSHDRRGKWLQWGVRRDKANTSAYPCLLTCTNVLILLKSARNELLGIFL